MKVEEKEVKLKIAKTLDTVHTHTHTHTHTIYFRE